MCTDLHIHTYFLTPWNKVLEKPTGLRLVKRFSAFYGTRRFITAFASARHLFSFWASSIHSMPPHPTSWRSILILSSHVRLGLSSGLLPSGFPNKTLYMPLPPIRARCPAHLIPYFYNPRSIRWGVQIVKLIIQCSPFPVTSSLSSALIFSSTPYSQTPLAYVPPSISATKFHTHTKQQAKL